MRSWFLYVFTIFSVRLKLTHLVIMIYKINLSSKSTNVFRLKIFQKTDLGTLVYLYTKVLRQFAMGRRDELPILRLVARK
jgi:hypothetical protein